MLIKKGARKPGRPVKDLAYYKALISRLRLNSLDIGLLRDTRARPKGGPTFAPKEKLARKPTFIKVDELESVQLQTCFSMGKGSNPFMQGHLAQAPRGK
jgi:hypothetical protein